MYGAKLPRQVDSAGDHSDRTSGWRILLWRGGLRWSRGEELLRRGMFPPRKYFSSEMMDWRSSAAD
jgi:hypothetical protein